MLIIARKPKTNDQRNKPTIRPYRIPRFHPPHPQKILPWGQSINVKP